MHRSWSSYRQVDEAYFRPTEVETLLGDPSLAKSQLGWAPECSIHELAKEMMAHDMSIARSAVILRNATSE